MTANPADTVVELDIHDCKDQQPFRSGDYLTLCYNGKEYQWTVTLYTRFGESTPLSWDTIKFLGEVVKWAELPKVDVINGEAKIRTEKYVTRG